jgi:hypothetical protein
MFFFFAPIAQPAVAVHEPAVPHPANRYGPLSFQLGVAHHTPQQLAIVIKWRGMIKLFFVAEAGCN